MLLTKSSLKTIEFLYDRFSRSIIFCLQTFIATFYTPFERGKHTLSHYGNTFLMTGLLGTFGPEIKFWIGAKFYKKWNFDS